MECAHTARPRIRIEAVGEMGLYPSRFVQDSQWTAPSRKRFRKTLRISAGVDFDPGERGAKLLRLYHGRGLTVDVQQVICLAITLFERKLA